MMASSTNFMLSVYPGLLFHLTVLWQITGRLATRKKKPRRLTRLAGALRATPQAEVT